VIFNYSKKKVRKYHLSFGFYGHGTWFYPPFWQLPLFGTPLHFDRETVISRTKDILQVERSLVFQ